MEREDSSQLEDLLAPLRSLGWTTRIDENGNLQLHHPLEDAHLHADTPEEMRRMLHQRFAPDSPFMEAMRAAPQGRADDLAIVGDIIRVCRAFTSSPRLPSAVIGAMADRGLVDGTTYEWLHEHADVVAGRFG